jgi:hypothetical protein
VKNNTCAKKKWCNITYSPKRGKKNVLVVTEGERLVFKYFNSVWTALWSKDEEENDK